MKYPVLLTALLVCPGCTTLALERHALTQQASPTDLRYREVLDNLAMVARDPAALPAYSSIFAGSAQVTDTTQLASTTTLGPGAGAQLFNPQFNRVVLGNWALDPLNAPEKLEAIRCACRWVIYGPELACRDCPGLLATPEQAPFPGRHFGVADRLEGLPGGWLGVGRKCDLPATTSFKAHSGPVWVWVMPSGVQALADFTLVLQDIARVDINSPTLQVPRPTPSDFFFPALPVEQTACPSDNRSNGARVFAEVSVDPCGRLVSDLPYYRWRVENVGTDSYLRSQINAAGFH